MALHLSVKQSCENYDESEPLILFFLQEYSELMHEFMTAVKQNYGEKVVIQVSLTH